MLLGDIRRVLFFRDVPVRNDSMLRECFRNSGDLIHQVCTDPAALGVHRLVSAKPHRLAQANLSELRRNVYGNKAKLFSGFFILQLCYVNKLILKIIYDMIVLHVMLREDHDAFPLLQLLYCILEGGKNAGIVVNTDGPGTVKYTDR